MLVACRQAAAEWAVGKSAYHTSMVGAFVRKIGGSEIVADPQSHIMEADSLHPGAVPAFLGSLEWAYDYATLKLTADSGLA